MLPVLTAATQATNFKPSNALMHMVNPMRICLPASKHMHAPACGCVTRGPPSFTDDMEARRQQGQQGNDASVLYRLDLALRKRTAALIAGSTLASGPEKAALGKRCSDARKQCLADCRRRLSVPGACVLQRHDMDAFLWQQTLAFDQCADASL